MFIECLNKQQKEYAKFFSEKTIEMNDFCVRLENTPDF